MSGACGLVHLSWSSPTSHLGRAGPPVAARICDPPLYSKFRAEPDHLEDGRPHPPEGAAHTWMVFHVTILTDPVYLTEPLIKSQTFNLIIPEGQNWVYPLRTRDRDPSSARHCAALLTWRESVSA